MSVVEMLVTPEMAKRWLSWETEDQYAERMDRHYQKNYGKHYPRCCFGFAPPGVEESVVNIGSHWNAVIYSRCPTTTKKLIDDQLVVCWRLAEGGLPGNVVKMAKRPSGSQLLVSGGQALIDIVMTGMPTTVLVETEIGKTETLPAWCPRPEQRTIFEREGK